MTEYSNASPSELLYIARLLFRSKDYYSDWIEYENGKLVLTSRVIKCKIKSHNLPA
jgi:hypothetical protein